MAAQPNEREKAIAMAIVGVVIVIIIILFAGGRGATIFPGLNYTPPVAPIASNTDVPKAQQYTNPVWPTGPSAGPVWPTGWGDGAQSMQPADLAALPVFPGYLPPGETYYNYGTNPSGSTGCCGCG